MNRTQSRYLVAAAVASLLLLSSCSGETDEDEYEAALTSLVESERAFSAASAELGTRDAFIAFMADDAVIFRPRVVNAQEYLRAQPAGPGLLSWGPAFADVADAGDLGFTTGPWKFAPDPESEPIAFGQYFTFWKKQPDGTWKVVIDHGTTQPEGETVPAVRTPARVEQDHDEAEVDIETMRESLLERDLEFAGALARALDAETLAGFADRGVRLLRNGGPPVHGIETMQTLVGKMAGNVEWTVLGGDVSNSGDLGYTYGEYSLTAPTAEESGNYVRAWRRSADGAWRILVDVMVPVPPDPAG